MDIRIPTRIATGWCVCVCLASQEGGHRGFAAVQYSSVEKWQRIYLYSEEGCVLYRVFVDTPEWSDLDPSHISERAAHKRGVR